MTDSLLNDLAQGRASARAIARAVQGGTLSAAAVAETMLDRVARIEPWLKAFIHLDAGAVRQAARDVPAGPLAGIPFGVKDVIDTCDLPTAYGSAAYPGWQPVRDAPAVHFVRQAGAVILGKTVSTEFATMAPGATVNPFDPARTPGGSSSGSAAALGAGLCLMAFGTQTSGSTIRPAAYCGVAALKPSPGLIERFGVKPLSATLDVVGPMARDVRDLSLLAAVAARRGDLAVAEEAGHAPAPMGLFLPPQGGAPDFTHLERIAGLLGAVSTRAVPAWWDPLGEAQADVFAWESSAALAVDHDLHWDRLHPKTHIFFERHAGASAARWQAGLAARDAALGQLDQLFGAADFLMTPAAPGEAPLGLGSTGDAGYNIRWTLLGLPSVTVPAGFGPAGMPLGLQLIGRPGQDGALLAQAARVEDMLRAKGIPARPELAPELAVAAAGRMDTVAE